MNKLFYLVLILFSFTIDLFSQDSIKFVLVKNINKKPQGYNNYDGPSYPMKLTVFNDKIVFVAVGDSVGQELYISDGTSDGTSLLKNINAYHQNLTSYSDNDSQPYALRVFGNKLIFAANDDVNGYEPWISDGTTNGTVLLKDIMPPRWGSYYSSNPGSFVEFNGKVYFTADEGFGHELYVSDGTNPGTFMLKNISTSGYGSGGPGNFKEYNGKLFFSAIDSNDIGTELWCTDGTELGTIRIKDINPNGASNPWDFIEYKSKLYFSADCINFGRELWVTDGTGPGTKMFKDINLKKDLGSFPSEFVIMNDKLFFTASDSAHDTELWCTDGDTAYMVKDISPEIGAMAYSVLHVFGNSLYFKARTSEYSNHTLWVSDGTEEGTFEKLSGDSSLIDEPECFTNWHNNLVFKAKPHYTESGQLWITNEKLKYAYQIFPDSITGWNPIAGSELVLFKDEIFFSGRFIDSIDVELYKITKADLSVSNQNIPVHFESDISVYPNPASDEVNMEMNEEEKIVLFTIIDLSGKILYTSRPGSNKISVDIQNLNTGVYILHVKTNEKIYIKRIIKI